jgi:peptidoglycan/LPS O-acetylase OafA/YrhL
VPDLLRAAALVRVVAFHAVGMPYALTWFPALPLMFFFGGSFMEASMARTSPLRCIASRYRRVLVPLLPFSALALAVYGTTGHLGALTPRQLVSLFVPLLSYPAPAGPVDGDSALGWTFIGLWYLQMYLLFVTLSPLLRWALARWPRLLLAALAVTSGTALAFGDGGRMLSFLLAWTAGMLLRRTPADAHRRACRAAAGVALVAGSVVFLAAHGPRPDPTMGRWDTLATALLGLAWISGSIGFRAGLEALAARAAVQRGVGWLNAHAVSVYLWHFAAFGAGTAIARAALGPAWGAGHGLISLVVTIPLGAVLAAAAGPIEDFAAGRRPSRAPGSTGAAAARVRPAVS